MGLRSKTAFLSGTITDNPLTDVATTINSAGLASIPEIIAPQIAVIVLDPTGSGGAPEVIWITAHTTSATSATIARGKEGSSARQHASGVSWVHGPTIQDLEEEEIHQIERELSGTSLYRNVSRLGAVVTIDTAGNTTFPIAQGWGGFYSSTSAAIYGVGNDNGMTLMETGATSGQLAAFFGMSMDVTDDPTLIFRGALLNEASRSIFIGFSPESVINPTDGNDRIGFRVLTSGNIVGVSDNAGTETTRDTGAVPDGAATLTTLKVMITDGGTIVRFFKDGTQVGANVTTNIPAGQLMPFIGIINATTATKQMHLLGAAYWREV